MTCNDLPTEDLVAWIDRELPSDEDARVRVHVERCAVCTREAALLRHAGELVSGLPQQAPSTDFAERVLAATRNGTEQPRGLLRRMWPGIAAAAAAAVLVAMFIGQDDASIANEVLSASEQREIAEDLLVLSTLDALEGADPEELISLVEDLDLLESLEPEVTGAYLEDGEEEGG